MTKSEKTQLKWFAIFAVAWIVYMLVFVSKHALLSDIG